LRSIINPLAATSNFSAVEFLPPGSLLGTLVLNCVMHNPTGTGGQITRCARRTQELID
jgi:hypothetical protein